MTSIRLSNKIEKKLDNVVKFEHLTKSDIIKKALDEFLKKYENQLSPYELGKEVFGKYGSGKNNLSKDYKKIIKKKIHAKYSNWCWPNNFFIW